ncbi:hypothetical protein ES332_A10G105900v1 [Gossypium tomentosum]|uniref:Uncharacterized protein n=1 Tax=Gossypium tomentosum TaxID=34277 RepID=A0A5D2NPM3_GOSTO|nr:hypothetical protein ES332_A10G105900v1 [Gossypium tomentosum]
MVVNDDRLTNSVTSGVPTTKVAMTVGMWMVVEKQSAVGKVIDCRENSVRVVVSAKRNGNVSV